MNPVAPANPRSVSTPRSFSPSPLTVFLVALAFGAAALWVWSAANATRRNQRLAASTRDLSELVGDRLRAATGAAEVLATLVTRDDGRCSAFTNVAANLLASHPFVAALELQPNGITTEVVPATPNRPAIGLNAAQDPAHRPGAMAAYRSRQLVLAGPLRLPGGEVGLIARRPVFLRGQDGKERFWGFTAATIRAADLVPAATFSRLTSQNLAYSLAVSVGPSQSPRLINSSQPSLVRTGVNQSFQLGGLQFHLTLASVSANRVLTTVGYGLGLLLIAGFAAALAQARDRLRAANESAAQARHRADRDNARFTGLWEATNDGLALTDAEGRILDANPKLTNVLGCQRSDLIHQPLEQFIPNLAAVQRPSMGAKGANPPVSLMVRRANGTAFPSEVTVHARSTADAAATTTLYHVRDITALRQAKAALTESNARLAVASQSARLGTWEREFAANRLSVSEDWLSLFGITQEAAGFTPGQWVERVHPEDRERVLRELGDFAAGRSTHYDTEFRLVHAKGNWVWVASSGTVLDRQPDGTVARMAGVDRDITDWRLLKQSHDSCTEQLRLVLECSCEGIMSVDTHGDIVFVNAAACQLLGCRADELLDQTAHRYLRQGPLDGNDHAVEESGLYAAYSLGRTSRVENGRLWRKDGTHLPVEYTAAPMLEDHRVVGALVCFTDVSLRRLALRQLADGMNLRRALLNAVPHPMFIQDAAGSFLDCNSAYEDVFAVTAESRRGRAAFDLALLPGDQRDKLLAVSADVLRDVGQSVCEISMPHPDGEPRAMMCSLAAYRSTDGQCAGLVGLFVDEDPARRNPQDAEPDGTAPTGQPEPGIPLAEPVPFATQESSVESEPITIPPTEANEPTTDDVPGAATPTADPALGEPATVETVTSSAPFSEPPEASDPAAPAMPPEGPATPAPLPSPDDPPTGKPRRRKRAADNQLSLFATPADPLPSPKPLRMAPSHHAPIGLARLRDIAAEMERLLTDFDATAATCLEENREALRTLFTALEFQTFEAQLAAAAFDDARVLLASAAAKSGLAPTD